MLHKDYYVKVFYRFGIEKVAPPAIGVKIWRIKRKASSMSVSIFFSIQTDVLQSIIDEDVHFKNFMEFQKKKNFLAT